MIGSRVNPRVLLALLGGAHLAGCGGPETAAPAGGYEGQPKEARCPAEAEALSVAGTTLPPLAELARFALQGDASFFAHEEDVYWVSYGGGTSLFSGPTTIEAHRLTLGETTPRRLWSEARPGSRRSMFGKLFASGPDLVWVEFFPSKPPTSGTVYALPRAGGAATVLREGIETTTLNGSLRALGTDDASLYISPVSPVGISALSRTTGQVTSHIARAVAPRLAAFEGEHLIWVEGDSLWRARRDGTEAGRLATGLPAVDALAVHAGASWLVTGPGATPRLLRVAIQGASATCTASSWPEAGRSASIAAGAGGVYLAVREASGETADAVWRIDEEGRSAWRLLGSEVGRTVQLLAPRADGLLLAFTHPGGWALGRLPPRP
jgi:hypothetical protein